MSNFMSYNNANSVLGEYANKIKEKADLLDLAPAFSTSVAYSTGDYVSYQGDIYKFTSNHAAGAWNTSDVTRVTIANEINNGGGSGGHTMLPAPAAGLTIADIRSAIAGALLEGPTNDDVMSIWSMAQWSNVLTSRVVYNGTIAVGDNTIGEWLGDSALATLKAKSAADRAVDEAGYGWWYDAHFIGLDLYDGYELHFKNKDTNEDMMILGGYVIDTDTGYLCVKFANTAKVATNKIAVDVTIVNSNISYTPAS